MEKKWLKIALDIIMLFVFLLLFIKGVTSKLFCTNIPLRTRIVYVLNLPRPISLFLCIIICMFGIYSLSAPWPPFSLRPLFLPYLPYCLSDG